MRDYTKFYINGQWVEAATAKPLDVINPATEEVAGRITLGSYWQQSKYFKLNPKVLALCSPNKFIEYR